MDRPDSGSAVRLAIGILLLWLAGLAFFVAFEGAKFLGETTGPGGYVTAILQEITRRAQEQEGSP